MEDIIEGLLELVVFSGDNNKKGGCIVPIIILLVVIGLCVAWYYFGNG